MIKEIDGPNDFLCGDEDILRGIQQEIDDEYEDRYLDEEESDFRGI